MKTLKFRIYDGIKKAMEYRDMETIANLGWPLMEAKEAVQNGKVMMFTGLLDRLGKEIYEGDVLENKNCRYLNRAECYFEDGSFQFKASGCNQCDEYLCNNVTREFEVIGSIYENPELLKESKK
jgi:hypothetical protein